jgi:hypothetical protein
MQIEILIILKQNLKLSRLTYLQVPMWQYIATKQHSTKSTLYYIATQFRFRRIDK